MTGKNGEDRSILDAALDVDEDDLRVLVDGEGNEMTCVLLAIVGHGEHDYAMLAPLESIESDDEILDVFLLLYEVDEDGDETFSEVEDEATYEQVVAYASTLLPTTTEGMIDDEDDDADDDDASDGAGGDDAELN